MEYTDKIVISDKESTYIGLKISRAENDNFIKANGDIDNEIHTEEKKAYNLLKRIGLESLGPGVIVAGELIKQKVLLAPEIKGIPYKMRIELRYPLVINNEVYINYKIKEISSEPQSYRYEFEIKKDNNPDPIMDGEIISIGKMFWSMDGKQPNPLKGLVLGIENIIAGENLAERYYKSLGENDETIREKENNGGSTMAVSSLIAPKMISYIKEAVSKVNGEDPERQYMLNSQNLTVYRKNVDLSAPLSFYFSQPVARKRSRGIFCSTTVQVKSKNENVIECILLGTAV